MFLVSWLLGPYLLHHLLQYLLAAWLQLAQWLQWLQLLQLLPLLVVILGLWPLSISLLGLVKTVFTSCLLILLPPHGTGQVLSKYLSDISHTFHLHFSPWLWFPQGPFSSRWSFGQLSFGKPSFVILGGEPNPKLMHILTNYFWKMVPSHMRDLATWNQVPSLSPKNKGCLPYPPRCMHQQLFAH